MPNLLLLPYFRSSSTLSEDNVKPQNDEENDEDALEFDPIPCEIVEKKMIFVYQSEEMQRLYRRYARNLVLLDATYRTTMYSLPLYFLVVQTNVNYQVAAVIVTQEETTEMITKALSLIKGKVNMNENVFNKKQDKIAKYN